MQYGKRKATKAGKPEKQAKAGPRRVKHRVEIWDYGKYRFCQQEWAKYGLAYLGLDAVVSYLFFRSRIAFLVLLPGAGLFFREMRTGLLKKRKVEITNQFLDGIQLMLASLQAGYSPENAVSEALRELKKMHSAEAVIVREFARMEAQIRMSRSVEDLMLDFGRRSGVADIVSFAEVFLTAKRTGGDLIAVIQNTISCIRQKQETAQEIATCIAGKQMEHNIMSMIPIAMLAYVKLTSPDFLDVMYETGAGVAVMMLCFVVYVFAWFWGQSMVRIEV